MDRVWNTIIRGDHQVNNTTTYSVRWLREQSPQVNQIIPTGTQAAAPAAAREESDVDQTVSFNLNSVLASTKVSTFRVTWTRENVTFANNCFNTNGRDMVQCPVTLGLPGLHRSAGQHRAGAHQRRHPGRRDAGVVHSRQGRRPRRQVRRCRIPYSAAYNTNQGNLNGTFSFGRSNAVFNAAIPSTYPDRLTVRVGGPNVFYQKAHYVSGFAQDKWRLGNNSRSTSACATTSRSCRSTRRTTCSSATIIRRDSNNIAPRFGLTYDLGGTSVIRAGVGRFYDKTHFEVIGGLYTGTPYASSFLVNFPTAAADNGPRNGQLPTDPFLVNGPVLNRTLLDQLYPGGQLLRNTGATWDNPDRVVPYSDEISIGYERQLGAAVVGERRLPALARPRPVRAAQSQPAGALEPGGRASTLVRVPSPELVAATAQLAQKYPGFTPFTTNVIQFVNDGESDYNALMAQLKKRFSNNYSLQVSYTLAKATRQRRRQRRAVEQLPGAATSSTSIATKGRRISTTAIT